MANNAFGVVKLGLERWPGHAAYILGVGGCESEAARLKSLKAGDITLFEFLADHDISKISACIARVFALTSDELAVDTKA